MLMFNLLKNEYGKKGKDIKVPDMDKFENMAMNVILRLHKLYDFGFRINIYWNENIEFFYTGLDEFKYTYEKGKYIDFFHFINTSIDDYHNTIKDHPIFKEID